ncbi:hypothetical protein AAC387_Pa12g0709 [Persea americana]
MLGDFITRLLVMVLGYAYPAFECFKTVEKNKADIEQLRFWCQYWIIVAMVTVFERIGEVLVSWLPMYGEMKLAFLIYLWYPKTKGTHYVYETLLRPYFSKHEPEIDRKLLEYRARARDIALLYFQNFASQGQLKFYEFLQFLAKQSSRNWTSRNGDDQQQQQRGSPKQNSPTPPPSPSLKRSIQHPTVKADIVCQTLNETTGTVVEHSISPQRTATAADESGLEGTLRAARVRLRRAARTD